MTLRVLEIFDSLQGEGYWTGTPMTFVRLAGCNASDLGLACARWCDTRDSWCLEGGRVLAVSDVISKVTQPRVCLTGGEPLLQAEGVCRFVSEARSLGLKVHLETNGTIPPLGPEGRPGAERAYDWVVVSPKPPDYAVAHGWSGGVDELKFVADDYLTAAAVEQVSAAYPEAIVCIQPEWGARASDKAVAMVMQHPSGDFLCRLTSVWASNDVLCLRVE